MSNPLDPYNWGDYPSLAELAFEACTSQGCKAANHMPHSTRCWWHSSDSERAVIQMRDDKVRADLAEPTHEEQVQASVDAEDDRLADADWGDES